MNVFQNKDKDPIHEDHDDINPTNHVRISRVFISGRPGSGKTNIVKNIIKEQYPPFNYIQVMVADEGTKEYDFAETITKVEDIMNYQLLPDHEKLCVIFEDCEFASMSKKTLAVIDKLCRYGCTHKGVMCIIICQNFYSCPPGLRRKMDIFYITRADKQTQALISKVLPITKKQFDYMCQMYLISKYDSLCIDLSHPRSMFRKNMFEDIKIEDIDRKIYDDDMNKLKAIVEMRKK